MTVTLLKTDTAQPFDGYRRYLPLVSDERQERIARLRRDRDKTVSLFTELLIRLEISRALAIPAGRIKLGCGDKGKPFLAGQEGYHFSVSHSDGLIAFVGGAAPLGIDIQRMDGGAHPAERFFAQGEREHIRSAPRADAAFFEVWTAKEAYVKLLGAGLSKSFRSFDVINDDLGCSFFTRELDGYMLTVCCEAVAGAPEIREMRLSDLLCILDGTGKM